MPATSVIDDIELIIEDISGGGGKPPSRDDDGDDGGDGGNTGGEPRPDRRRSSPKKYSTAIALAMLSILMFFMVLTAAFVVLRFNNLHTWSAIRLPWILWVNTAVLLTSSASLELARRKLQDSLRGFKRLWALTTILGMIFLGGQVIAWRHLAAEGVYMASRLSSSFFYVFTALHAAHVLGGICALLYVRLRNFEAARVSRFIAAEVTSYYWHFMDGLWLFLLALLYFGQ
jgi:cytochrome c oxidase subunit 3